MQMEMYLDGQMVDTTTLIPSLWQIKSQEYLKSLVTELEKKHADVLKNSGSKATYIISGVQSSINEFTPLHHPDHSSQSGSNSKTVVTPPAETSLETKNRKPEPETGDMVENQNPNHIKRVA